MQTPHPPHPPGLRPLKDSAPQAVGAAGPGPSAGGLDALARKEQQLVFLLARQLVEAQIVQGDRARSQRLWQEVAALELDPERITALMYGVSDHEDASEMEAVDQRHSAALQQQHASAWFSWGRRTLPMGWRGAGRRSAPPAAPRAHRQAR